MRQGCLALMLVLALAAPPAQAGEGLVPTTVVGDAIPESLTGPA
jgi:sulfur-oxidizing protein SoxX